MREMGHAAPEGAVQGECREPLEGSRVIVNKPDRERRAEKSGASAERGTRHEARAEKKAGRPTSRWRIRVLRIDPGKYPAFAGDKDHPFAPLAPEARIEEIDSFFARLRARKNPRNPVIGGLRAAA